MIESVNIQPSKPVLQRPFLTFLLLGMLLVALLLFGQWFWLTHTLSAPEPQAVLPSERAPLLSSLFRQKPIVLSLLTSAGTMALALLVAVAPLSWWAQCIGMLSKTPGRQPGQLPLWGQPPQSAEEWVAAQATLLGVPRPGEELPNQLPGAPALVPGQPQPAVPGAPGQPPQPQQPGAGGAPGQPGTLLAGPPPPQQPGAPLAQQLGAPGQPPAGQQPGTPPAQQPGQGQQPGAPPVQQPGQGQQPQPADAQQPAAQPDAPQQPGQPTPAQPGQQQLLVPEEKLDLKELTDIGDILSSFKESDEIPAQLLALSQSLDEVAIDALLAHSRRVATHLATALRQGRKQAAGKSMPNP